MGEDILIGYMPFITFTKALCIITKHRYLPAFLVGSEMSQELATELDRLNSTLAKKLAEIDSIFSGEKSPPTLTPVPHMPFYFRGTIYRWPRMCLSGHCTFITHSPLEEMRRRRKRREEGGNDMLTRYIYICRTPRLQLRRQRNSIFSLC